MTKKQYFKSRIFNLQNEEEFSKLAMEMFHYQSENNEVYAAYLGNLNLAVSGIQRVEQIPFLPISFFKTHEITTGTFEPKAVFSSSGTGGQKRSRHLVRDTGLYEKSFIRGFERVYGPVEDFCILALLPSYLEREGSSLIYMARELISRSSDGDSDFYLDQYEKLYQLLLKKISENKKTFLLGVSFALQDFAEEYSLPQNSIIIMETGGMKGRRKEMIREELHILLQKTLGAGRIHSEYGMTELLSQAYSTGNGRFLCPLWMRVMIRQTDDPFSREAPGKTGGINIIDLANIDSCAFVETQDLGRIHADASFEVMGRFDNSDIRGCNLMVI